MFKSSLSKDEKPPFTTWTFDKPCDTMEWSDLPSPTISMANDLKDLEEADLVILGILAPPVEEDENEDDSKEEVELEPPTLEGKLKEIDELMEGALTELMIENSESFKNGASFGEITPTLRYKKTRYILVGLGNDQKDLEDGSFFKLGAKIASTCDAEKKISSCSILLPSSFLPSSSSSQTAISDITSQFYSTLYSDNRYRSGDKIETPVKDLTSLTFFLNNNNDDMTANNAAIQEGIKIAKGIYLSKDIVNAPHNILNSLSLANVAKKIASESKGTIECTVLDKAECEKRGMGAYLGVARGSETEPQFIHLTYKGKGTIKRKVGIIGKGLLFDTGGYNIKTAMMELMKFDCGGSAAVLGAARAIGELSPEGVEAHFIVAACENMINSKAMVPSDILTASNGKTIEVLNTDAEGRLTLADALVYADKELNCERIIELSTLTGAVMVSLGKSVCGVWSADDDLAKELAEVSKVTSEKSWRMPLEKEYNDQLKSKIADISNCGTRYGGAITAALFLQNFVSNKIPYAHIDIAGPVWDDNTGATGFGSKMVTEWVRRQGLD